MLKKLFALALLASSTASLAVDNYAVKDALGNTVTIRSKDIGSGTQSPTHILLDSTFNIIDPATKQLQQTLITALGSPFQAGGSVGILGTPTFNLGTLNGAATEATLAALSAKNPPLVSGRIPVDGSAVTQPVSVSTLPLPSGAAQDSSLTALGTKLDTLHGDLSASPTSIPAGANTIGSVGNLAAVTTGAPTYTTGTQAALSLDTSGNLRVITSGGAAVPTGTAGTPNAAVVSVQGVSGGTPQPTILTAGAATFGSIANTAFGISGTLPAFAATPTFNFGTLNGAATASGVAAVVTALGSPFQAGASIANTSFGISGTLPAFATPPALGASAATIGTVNLGTLNGAATAAGLTTINTTLGTPLQAGGTVIVSGVATAANQTVIQAAPGTSATTANAMQGVTGGVAVAVDTVVRSTAVDRGTIIGFTGAQITTTSGNSTITLTTAPTVGALVNGQQIVAAGVPAATTITLASGTLNVAGSTYTLSVPATASATGVVTTSVGPQQIMAANTARRGISYQVQSSSANVWTNGVGGATADFHSLKIPSSSYFESSPAHSGTGAISVISDTPATPLYAREW